MSRAVVAALALVTTSTLLLRTGLLDSGYWVDEAITVGIASHPLGDIPACASFGLGFLRGDRRHVWALGVELVLLLYTHNWALFLAAGMGAVWLWLWRAGRVAGRDGALLAAGVAAAYAPWVPSLLFQA